MTISMGKECEPRKVFCLRSTAGEVAGLGAESREPPLLTKVLSLTSTLDASKLQPGNAG